MAKHERIFVGEINGWITVPEYIPSKYSAEVRNIENNCINHICILKEDMDKIGVSFEEPYFQMIETITYSLVPKEFGGMETHLERDQQFRKINFIAEQVRRKQQQINDIYKEIVELQSKCEHKIVYTGRFLTNGFIYVEEFACECGYTNNNKNGFMRVST